jgi:ABC-type nitrate/sulfonate/bicarbonate transport system ATPase subunit
LKPDRPVGARGQLDVRIKRKTYRAAAGGTLDVLRDIVLTLGPGELGALLGPSGCGKTTILRIIAGLDAQYDGKLVLPPGRIGMVFQEPRLLPWRTVEQNVTLAAPLATSQAIDALFDVLELSAYRTHFPGELSLGMARRVALARAFAVEPALLLLDEPFVSLDQALALRLRDELVLLVESRSTMTLMVTHDVDEAVRLGDRLFLLSARPAHVVMDLAIPQPRALRTEAEIAMLKAKVADAVH